MRVMFDSITAADIPASAEIVGGYVEGKWKWTAEDWARFPDAVKVTIAVWAADADVLDVELGDATPDMAPDWIRRQQARGLAVPTVYCNLSTWPAVRQACAGLTFDPWIAEYGIPGTPSYGRPHLLPDMAATQYADPAAGSGGHYDLSLCADHWPRHAPKVEDMPNNIIAVGDKSPIDPRGEGATYRVVDWPMGPKYYLGTEAQVKAFESEGLPRKIVNQFVLDELLDATTDHYARVDPARSEQLVRDLKAELDQLAAARPIAAPTTPSGVSLLPLDLAPLLAKVDALSKHLGVPA
jgi:hypothetical protein